MSQGKTVSSAHPKEILSGLPAGKTGRKGRYLFYAIGEILLVVIGKLIALQINNWNLERIERKNEEKILQDLKVEFQENLIDAKRVFEGNEEIYNAISQIQINTLNKNYNQKVLDSLLYHVFDWFDYTPKPGASDNLINAGNLNLISNEQLRNLLTLWPGIIDELHDDEVLAVNYSQNVIIPFLAINYPLSNIEKYDNADSFYQNTIDNKINVFVMDTKNYKVEKLLRDPIFQSHISAKKIYARHNSMECWKVVNACDTILALIANESENSFYLRNESA